MPSNLSDEEVKTVERLLQKLEPGFLPLPIFLQVTRLTTTAIIEFVPLRMREGKVEILLTRRSADDPAWPSLLHTPGTVIRATDTLESAFSRLQTEELEGVDVSLPVFVKNVLHHSGRGLESSQVFWLEVLGEPKAGDFYPADDLPADLAASQMDFIPAAIDAYRNRHN